MLQNVCENCVRTPYVRHLVKKVKETVRTPENITAVAESVYRVPSTSIHHRSQQLNISGTSLRRTLHKDLGSRVV